MTKQDILNIDVETLNSMSKKELFETLNSMSKKELFETLNSMSKKELFETYNVLTGVNIKNNTKKVLVDEILKLIQYMKKVDALKNLVV